MQLSGTRLFHEMNVLMLLVVFVLECVVISYADDEKVNSTMDKGEGKRISQNCNECGLILGSTSPYHIILRGETVTPPNKYPWMVSIQSHSGEKICGGALISSNLILTAAHCLRKDGYEESVIVLPVKGIVHEKSPEALPDLLNITDILLPEEYASPEKVVVAFIVSETETGPRSPVAEVIPHEEYDGLNHDIGLLRLRENIMCDEYANPICLPRENVKLGNRKFVVTGWGKSDVEDSASVLHEARLTSVPFQDCSKIRSEYTSLIDTYRCVQGEKASTACYGDSGSSMFEEIEGKAYTVGIASMLTVMGCPGEMPLLFTSVAAHLSWITEKMYRLS